MLYLVCSFISLVISAGSLFPPQRLESVFLARRLDRPRFDELAMATVEVSDTEGIDNRFQDCNEARCTATGMRPGQSRTMFGMKEGHRPRRRAVNPYDYEQKYEEDEYGEEMGPNARFWRVVLDEGQIYDMEMVEGWRDTLDVLLIFAGLFSAVVTTLVVQSAAALQSNYALISASLTAELIDIQRAWAAGSPVDSVPRSKLTLDSLTASALDYWCNGFWFTSLALSLSAALMAVLIKQWLQAYSGHVSGTPRHQALVRQFRLIGIERWNVPLIVGLLPMLLHLSLMLFFIGLALYIMTFDTAIAGVVIAIAIAVYSLYFAANILPMVDCQCPYRTPLSQYGFIAFRYILTWTFGWLRRLNINGSSQSLPVASDPESAERMTWSAAARTWAVVHLKALARFLSPPDSWISRAREAAAVAESENSLMVKCLTWVYSASSNPTVASITVQAMSGLPLDVAPISHDEMLTDILLRLDHSGMANLAAHHRSVLERLARSLLFFATTDGDLQAGIRHALYRLDKHATNLTGCAPHSQTQLQGAVLALSATNDGETWLGLLQDYYNPLAMVYTSPPSTLRLPPVVWSHMLDFLACALFLLLSYLEDCGPYRRRQRRKIGAMSIGNLCDTDNNVDRLLNHAIHRILCSPRGGCSTLSKDRDIPKFAFSLHMFRHVLELAIDFTSSANSVFLEKADGVQLRAVLFDESIGSLAALLKWHLRNQAWNFLDDIAKVAQLPWVTLRTRRTLLDIYTRKSIPHSSVRPFIQLLMFLLRSVSAADDPPDGSQWSSSAQFRRDILSTLSSAIDQHGTEALSDASLREDILVASGAHIDRDLTDVLSAGLAPANHSMPELSDELHDRVDNVEDGTDAKGNMQKESGDESGAKATAHPTINKEKEEQRDIDDDSNGVIEKGENQEAR
ncbi:hypothetical protein BD626DRAFT_584611 [Schizophyllum amplum]|uniref:DUF6535 domain-containing protein n=1 Tax=Schizophyllum amplum TaxID=97359 RepID=A0A550C8X3_9AGAR|nr:hypothetical protein BD626DRAFT_584611 [Auriculariopsis ampla]